MRRLFLAWSAVMKSFVLASLLLAAILPLIGGRGIPVFGQVGQAQTAVAGDTEVNVRGYAFLITWKGTRTRDVDRTYDYIGVGDPRDLARDIIHDFDQMEGSAIYHYQAGDWRASMFTQTFTSDRRSETRFLGLSCGDDITWRRSQRVVIDPDRWIGSTDRRASIHVYRRQDGTYYMDDPLVISDGDWYTYWWRDESKELVGYAGGLPICETYTDVKNLLGSPTLKYEYQQSFEGGDKGITFTGQFQRQDPSTISPGKISWTVTAQRLGGCKGLSEPIDAASRQGAIKVTLQPYQPPNAIISPEGQAVLKAHVTCDGKAVRNAYLEMSVVADEKSGDHLRVLNDVMATGISPAWGRFSV